MSDHFLESVPLWLTFVLTVAFVLFSILGGTSFLKRALCKGYGKCCINTGVSN